MIINTTYKNIKMLKLSNKLIFYLTKINIFKKTYENCAISKISFIYIYTIINDGK